MRHLDDGQIAELIDAAGRRTGGPADGAAAEHLGACAVCRERLEEARRIAERARAILGTAVPAVEVSAPPFDEVLHRAGRARARRARATGWRALAWAATVVLAAGVGWYARGEWLGGARSAPSEVGVDAALADAAPVDESVPAPATPADSITAAAPVAQSLVQPVEPRDRDARNAARPDEPAGPPAESAAPRATPPGHAAPRRDTREAAAEAAAAPRPDLVKVIPESVAKAERRRFELRPAQPLAVQAPSAKADGVTGGLLGAPVSISREDAERILDGRPAAIEGLPIEGYFRLEGEPPGVRLVQRLPDGARVELEQRSAVVLRLPAPDALRVQGVHVAPDSAARRESQVSVDSLELDGLRILARAPIPRDSLRVLVGRLTR